MPTIERGMTAKRSAADVPRPKERLGNKEPGSIELASGLLTVAISVAAITAVASIDRTGSKPTLVEHQ